MTAENPTKSTIKLRAQLRLMLGDEIAFGPGKADLLDAIRETGSISNGGGTQLTELGGKVLQDYRVLQQEIANITGKHFENLKPLLRDSPLSSEK